MSVPDDLAPPRPRRPILSSDEECTAYLFNVSAEARPDEVAATMERLAIEQWGVAIAIDGPVRLFWLREDPENEEAMLECPPDHPQAAAVWLAEFCDAPEPVRDPDPSQRTLHPAQQALDV